MVSDPRPWTTDDVPSRPYLHGTSEVIAIGKHLITDAPRPEDPDPSYRDDRPMCWATTDVEAAFRWACQRNHSDPDRTTLFAYEVELTDPEVDTNVHGILHSYWFDDPITSVMAPEGVVRRVYEQRALSVCTRPVGICTACSRP